MKSSGKLTKKRSADLAGITSSRLLAALLDSGEDTLTRGVAALSPSSLLALVSTVGLEDAGELVALATPAQVQAVFDEALWKSDRPGDEEGFDDDRFALWLEVLLEAGEPVVVQALSGLSEDFLALALHRRALVFDAETLVQRGHQSDEPARVALDQALDARPSHELWGYLVVARPDADGGFDALVATLLALDERGRARGLAERLLARCAGLDEVALEGRADWVSCLTKSASLAEDVAGERADRRAAAGHVAPADARAFLRLVRRAPPPSLSVSWRAGEAPPRDPLTRAYFRELGTTSGGAADDREPTAAGSLSAQAARRLETLVAAAQAGERGEAALPPPLRTASPADRARPPAAAPLLQRGLRLLEERAARSGSTPTFVSDAARTALAARGEELAYLGNVLIAAMPDDEEDEAMTPSFARRAALATTELGLDLALRERFGAAQHAPEDKMLVEMLEHESADRLFHRGLHALQHGVALTALRELVRRAEVAPKAADPSGGALALARRALADGEPWRVRRSLALGRLAPTLDDAERGLFRGLLAPLPRLPDRRLLCSVDDLRRAHRALGLEPLPPAGSSSPAPSVVAGGWPWLGALLGLGVSLCALACGTPASAPSVKSPDLTTSPASQVSPDRARLLALSFRLTAEESSVEAIGTSIMGTHLAQVDRFSGEVTFVPAMPEKSQIDVALDMTSLTTALPPLTAVMRSPNFFDVQRFPDAAFHSTRVRALPASATTSVGGAPTTTEKDKRPHYFQVEGELTLHGVTRPIAFETALVEGEGFLTARAELRLNRRAFGVIYQGVLDPLINDEVVVRLWAQGRPTRQWLPVSGQ
jgi:polyisoprenoid-binding protein YceI